MRRYGHTACICVSQPGMTFCFPCISIDTTLMPIPAACGCSCATLAQRVAPAIPPYPCSHGRSRASDARPALLGAVHRDGVCHHRLQRDCRGRRLLQVGLACAHSCEQAPGIRRSAELRRLTNMRVECPVSRRLYAHLGNASSINLNSVASLPRRVNFAIWCGELRSGWPCTLGIRRGTCLCGPASAGSWGADACSAPSTLTLCNF